MQEKFIENLWSNLAALREKRPLVHNITNAVVTNFSANALLAVGASPLMSHAVEELEEIVGISNALVINIGTLDRAQVDSMLTAIKYANEKAIPIIIDPVGAGASALRTDTAHALLEKAHSPILKANAGEVLALANQAIDTKGVDSLYTPDTAIDAARSIIDRYQAEAVVITGDEDVVLDRDQVTFHANGSPLMADVTGMGCILTAIAGAFVASNASAAEGARNAVTYMSIAGERAAKEVAGPGRFVPVFLDQLYTLTEEDLRQSLRLRKEDILASA